MTDSSNGLRIELLGPVEAWVDGRAVALGGQRPRALFAVLALMGGRVVAIDQLIDELWGEEPPARARDSLQMHVSRLRKRLAEAGADGGRLLNNAGGYLLEVRLGERDVDRWEQALGRARRARVDGEPRVARQGFEEALAVWRGQPFAGVSTNSLLAGERARLEEERLAAVIEAIELDLELGRHGELLGQLEAFVIAHPFKERLVELQMTALYRCGRQADALAAFHAARGRFLDELGIEPAQPLCELHEDVLRHSAGLSPPLQTTVVTTLAEQPGPAMPSALGNCKLPVPPNRTIGRDQDVVAVGERLRAGSVRLLTLTGPGGVGKTRLAVEAARAVGADFADGAHFVSLAVLDGPEDVPAAIVKALRIIVLSGESADQAAERFLAAKHLLLITDNVEQLLAAAPFIAGLLEACPWLTVLATSREPLALQAEERYPVSPLALPEPGTPKDPRELADTDAVTLFCERARAHDPDFDLNDGNAAAVAEICRRVDGLPLAIELAAARCGLLSPTEIADRLEPPAPDSARGLPAIARRRGRHGLLIAAGGAVLLAVLGVVAVRLSGSGASSVRVAPDSLAAIDTRSNRVTADVPLGARPGGVAFGSGSLWVANFDDQTVSRIDPRTLRTLKSIAVGGAPTGIATTARGVWVVESNLNPPANSGTSSVLVGRVDPEFDAPGRSVTIGNVDPHGTGAIAAQGNAVWVAPSTGLLTRIDAMSGRTAEHLDPNATPAGLAIGEGAIWLTDSEANNVVRVDPTGLPAPIAVGNGPRAITVGAGGVWVVDSLDDKVVRIDPVTRSVTEQIPVGRSPGGVAFGAGSVWVANSGDGTVTRINPSADKPIATIAVGGSPQAITIADGRAWVTVDAQSIAPSHGGSGGGTLRIASSLDVDSMDPALAYGASSWRLLYATCAKLVNYPDKGGAAGSQLTPEVAQSLPARSPDGRTYTFKIRPGFRFSPPSDQPVTAETFKGSIERTLNPRMHSPMAQYLADVVGAPAYMAGKASHIAGVVANRDTLTIKLLRPAPDFLSRIAMPGFCAVPSNTPPQGVRAVPSAGPYSVASYTPGQGVVLMRNPNYHGSRPRHFARIELAVGIPAQRAVDEIEAGNTDYTTLGLDSSPSTNTIAALGSQLAARFGPGSAAATHGRQRYFVNPVLQLDFFSLNPHRLFSDVRMRQAVNYAIDRRRLAALGSPGLQPLPERPTDQYLPPGMPGFRDGRIYPMTPDQVKARQLLRLAHAGGRTAVLYTVDAPPGPEEAQIVKNDLAAIGLQVQIKTLPVLTLFSRLAKPGEPWDLAYSGWVADYPDPTQILNLLIEDSSLAPTFDDPAYRRQLARAEALSGPERYLTYGGLDLALARNAAPLAAFGNPSSHDFFSARIGCQTFGIYGTDLAALCVKRTPR